MGTRRRSQTSPVEYKTREVGCGSVVRNDRASPGPLTRPCSRVDAALEVPRSTDEGRLGAVDSRRRPVVPASRLARRGDRSLQPDAQLARLWRKSGCQEARKGARASMVARIARRKNRGKGRAQDFTSPWAPVAIGQCAAHQNFNPLLCRAFRSRASLGRLHPPPPAPRARPLHVSGLSAVLCLRQSSPGPARPTPCRVECAAVRRPTCVACAGGAEIRGT